MDARFVRFLYSVGLTYLNEKQVKEYERMFPPPVGAIPLGSIIFSVINWTFTLIAITGTFYVSVLKQPYIGQWFWAIANVGLIACCAKSKSWPYFAMFLVYFFLSIWGIWNWH